MRTCEKVRKYREDRHLTQEQMAEQLSLTPSSYAKLERGETRINIERLQQIANILKIDISELLSDDAGVVKLAIAGNNSIAGDNFGTQYQNCEVSETFKDIQNLKKELEYKDTIIADKDDKIKILQREVTNLQKMVEWLESKK